MKGLLIKKEWIDLILSGAKTWELRRGKTSNLGEVALIQSGSGTVVGLAELSDVIGPLSVAKLLASTAKHRVPAEYFAKGPPYKPTCAWVMSGARRLCRPVPYKHPKGAVIWVNLAPSVAKQVLAAS